MKTNCDLIEWRENIIARITKEKKCQYLLKLLLVKNSPWMLLKF